MAASLTQTNIVEGLHIGSETKLFKKTVTFSAGNPAADLASTSIGTAFSGRHEGRGWLNASGGG